VSLGQLKVMSAIESCRTAALGGHVARCEKCSHTHIAYNSCRNRHCPKCQGAAAKQWLAEREADLLPVPYYHVVFRLPAPIGDIAYQNKAAIYGELLNSPAPQTQTNDPDAATEPSALAQPCPCCGSRMIIIETFRCGCSPRDAGPVRRHRLRSARRAQRDQEGDRGIQGAGKPARAANRTVTSPALAGLSF
jgi:hypothetical protein